MVYSQFVINSRNSAQSSSQHTTRSDELLLLESCPQMRRLLKVVLALELNLEVKMVAHSCDAWALCQEHDFALVILSMDYPEMDLFQKSILQWQGLRCLIFTDRFGMGQFLDYPCLGKPFKLAELIPTVRNLLLKSRALEE